MLLYLSKMDIVTSIMIVTVLTCVNRFFYLRRTGELLPLEEEFIAFSALWISHAILYAISYFIISLIL